eukprot:XP_015573406.1 uncharacterized protein LOC8278736 isoform X2 [Ricinus communis]
MLEWFCSKWNDKIVGNLFCPYPRGVLWLIFPPLRQTFNYFSYLELKMDNAETDIPSSIAVFPYISLVSGTCDRTVVALQCSHLFHLDCIGSAFNASDSMRCPNCRQAENGRWFSFKDDNPESDTDEVTDNEDSHPSSEMEPFHDHLSPTARLFPELYLLNEQVMNEELVRFSGNPHFNPYLVGPLSPGEIAASRVLQVLHYQGSIAHQSIIDPQQISAQAVPWWGFYWPRIDPVSMLQQESISRWAILESMFGAQTSFQPSINLGSFGNIGLPSGNFTRVQPPSNLPSPAVSAMAAGRSVMNGLQGHFSTGNPVTFSEQTQRLNHMSTFAPPQSDPQSHNTTPVDPFMAQRQQAAHSEWANGSYPKRLENCWRSID